MTAIVTRDLEQALRILREDGIVAVPTETVYGLAARALSRSAVERVFAAKGRPRDHPLIVHVHSIDQARQWGFLDDRAERLVYRFWPGPLTILVPRRPIVPDWVTGARDTVALRMPDHAATLRVIEELGEPIVAPSANKFGKVSPTTARHVLDELGNDIDAIIDGGPCAIGVESTIVECVAEIQILRPGAVTTEQVEAEIGSDIATGSGPSRAPGMLASHYAPNSPVLLCSSLEEAQTLASTTEGLSVLIHEPDEAVFARNLYRRLREADSMGVDRIIVVLAPDHGLGAAINDRLAKAAAATISDRRAD